MKHIFLLLALFALVACGEPASAPMPKLTQAISVKVSPVTLRQHRQPIFASGIVAYKETSTLSFKVGGIIQAIYVDEGDRIQKGQIIAQLAQEEIMARVLQAKSAKDKAERDLRRIQKLYYDHVVTHEQLQNATTALDMAKAELDIAQFNQKHAIIRAPVAGRVLRRFAERNELVSLGAPIVRLASNERHSVLRVGIIDRDIIHINLGDTASVTFAPYPNRTFKAAVSEIAEQANPQTGTFEIELSLKESDLLKSGFVGHATLYPSAQVAHYCIPIDAVVEANKSQAMLYIPDGSVARRLMVYPNAITDDYIIVYQTPGLILTQVITDGASYLQDRSLIHIQ
jgi:multidrug efflux system membrane fusion protein